MAIKKIEILGAVLELPAKQLCRFGQFGPILGWIGSAPRIFIFSIVLGAEYLFYLKFIATYAPTFCGYIISVLAMVLCHFSGEICYP